jgi:dolichyl-phosphate-mannose--protein O-mannosyl transferase
VESATVAVVFFVIAILAVPVVVDLASCLVAVVMEAAACTLPENRMQNKPIVIIFFNIAVTAFIVNPLTTAHELSFYHFTPCTDEYK